MENIFGGLIEYQTKKEFEDQLDVMDKTLALSLIESAINYAHSNGVFTMDESYCLYKSFSKLKEE